MISISRALIDQSSIFTNIIHQKLKHSTSKYCQITAFIDFWSFRRPSCWNYSTAIIDCIGFSSSILEWTVSCSMSTFMYISWILICGNKQKLLTPDDEELSNCSNILLLWHLNTWHVKQNCFVEWSYVTSAKYIATKNCKYMKVLKMTVS